MFNQAAAALRAVLPAQRPPALPARPAPQAPLNPTTETWEQQDAREEKEGELWLASEKYWTKRVGKGWIAKRVLGRGGQGIVGWWSYEGNDRGEKSMVDVVVKQASLRSHKGHLLGGLTKEAEILSLFKASGSRHIPKIYRRLYEDKGAGSSKYDHWEVQRIFLEYCEGGDLFSLVENKIERYATDETVI